MRLPPAESPHEHDAPGIGVADKRAGEQLPRHGVAVLKRGGEAVLGAAPVVDGDDAALELQRRAHAGVAVEFHVAVGPAAAVQVQDGAAVILVHV